jgi:hypothetical protein
MQLKTVYTVSIRAGTEKNGELKTTGFYVFTGEGAQDEVRRVVQHGLMEMRRVKERRFCGPFPLQCDIGGRTYPVVDIINDKKLLDDFINMGGEEFESWSIVVFGIGDTKPFFQEEKEKDAN